MIIKAEKTNPHAYPLKRRVGDGGIDIALPQDILLFPQRSVKVDCGWRFELPGAWHLLALQKSRHAGEWIVEAPLIDHAYRGSVHAVLHYLGTDPITVPKGEYVMQLLPVFSPHMEIVEESVDQLTLRGDGAFGSTMET